MFTIFPSIYIFIFILFLQLAFKKSKHKLTFFFTFTSGILIIRNRWEDGKQIILSTNTTKSNSDSGLFTKNLIFFAEDSKGVLKILLVVVSSANTEEVFHDADMDGLADEIEKCEGSSKYDPNCKKTDPQKRDTDGDGWWDGVDNELEN